MTVPGSVHGPEHFEALHRGHRGPAAGSDWDHLHSGRLQDRRLRLQSPLLLFRARSARCSQWRLFGERCLFGGRCLFGEKKNPKGRRRVRDHAGAHPSPRPHAPVAKLFCRTPCTSSSGSCLCYHRAFACAVPKADNVALRFEAPSTLFGRSGCADCGRQPLRFAHPSRIARAPPSGGWPILHASGTSQRLLPTAGCVVLTRVYATNCLVLDRGVYDAWAVGCVVLRCGYTATFPDPTHLCGVCPGISSWSAVGAALFRRSNVPLSASEPRPEILARLTPNPLTTLAHPQHSTARKILYSTPDPIDQGVHAYPACNHVRKQAHEYAMTKRTRAGDWRASESGDGGASPLPGLP
eukprot:2289902-Rhodomonas_salina.3